MVEYDVRKTFFALPENGSEPRKTANYAISLPTNMPIQTRIRLCNAVSKAIQEEADKMRFEEFEFTSKKQ